MLHRVTTFGRSALDALREAVAASKAADPMAPVTVVVPTNIAGIATRRFLAGGLTDGSNGIAGIWFTTLPRLAERLAAPALHAAGRQPITEPVLATAIRRQLDQDAGIFAPVAEHPATAQAIARAHRELRDVADPTALEAIATASTLGADLIRLHRQITADLAADYYDSVDLFATATELADNAEFGTVIAYLLLPRGNHEQVFLDALATTSPMATIEGGSTIVTDGVPAVAQRVLTASDSDDEVRCVVREVAGILQETPAHRVGVLYSDRVPYARLLHEHFAQAGIVTNGAGVRPVVERAVPRLLLGLLETARTGWGRGDLMRTLSELGVHDQDGESIPTSRWERLSREAGIVSGADWQDRLTALSERHRRNADEHRDSNPARAEHLGRQASAADRLRTFVTWLQSETDAAAKSPSWANASASLHLLLQQLLPEAARERMPLEEQYAAGNVERALSALSALDDGPESPSLAGIQDALMLTLEAGLPRVGRFGTGVFVAPIAEAVGIELDVVFIVGLSEDLYPGRLHDDSLLPERVREITGGQLRSLRDDIDRKERNLLAALQCAPSVTVSFPRGDLRRHTQRLPSRWVLPTLRHHADDPGLPATEYEKATGDWLTSSPSYAGGIAATTAPATEQEWRQRAALAHQELDEPALQAALATTSARIGENFSPYDGNLGDSDGLPSYREGREVLAATSLEAYAVCPHGYFVQRMLHVRPLEEPEASVEASAIDVGNLVHEVFDLWVREAVQDGAAPSYGQPWTENQRHRLREIAEARATHYERAGRTGHPALWERRKKIILATLDWMALNDSEWRAERDARVIGSELRFGDRDSAPVVVEIDGGIIAFRGSIDKVDEARDGTILVTDIKTGSAHDFKVLGEDNPVANGEKLQLPLYAQAARQLLDRPDAPVEASYWFVMRDRQRIGLPLSASVADTYRRTLGALVGGIESGIFPQRAPDRPDFLWVRCHYCNPDGLGHKTARDRWEQLRTLPGLSGITAIVEPDALATEDDA